MGIEYIKRIVYKIHGWSLPNALRLAHNDKSTLALCRIVQQHGAVEVFIEHGEVDSYNHVPNTLPIEYVKLETEVVSKVNFKSITGGIQGAINDDVDVAKTNSDQALEGSFNVVVKG